MYIVMIMRDIFSLSGMQILVTSRLLQPISWKEKQKLVTDIVILKLFTSLDECERFSVKKWPKKFTELKKKLCEQNPRVCVATNGEPRMGGGILYLCYYK